MNTFEFLKRLAHELDTQDDRGTSNPLFVVEQKRRFYGRDLFSSDGYGWMRTEGDHEEADLEETVRLDVQADGRDRVGDWERFEYQEYWEFVSAHLTEKAARRYLISNKHNMTEPRVYVTSQYRCHEFNRLIEIIKSGELTDDQS